MKWSDKVSQILRKPDFMMARPETEMCHLLVETVKRGNDKVAAVIEGLRGEVRGEIGIIPSLMVGLPVAALPELAQSGYVLRIWDDAEVETALDDAVFTSGSAAAQEAGYTGRGVVVAVLDTGIDPHDDLITPDNRILAWNDIINHQTLVYDDHGHGTCVAGVIAGNGMTADGQNKGIAPEARLVGVKVLDQTGRGRISGLMRGMEWCLANLGVLNIKVINLSISTAFQGPPNSDPLLRCMRKAWRNDVVVCMAAGSKGLDYSPDRYPNRRATYGLPMITAGNWNEERIITADDSRLTQVNNEYFTPDLIAPGSGVTSLKPGGGYDTFSGGSVATAIVTGGIAQLLQRWPLLKPGQIKLLLRKTAKDTGLGTQLQGAGLIDPAKALRIRNPGKPAGTALVPVQNAGNNVLNMAMSLLGSGFGNGQAGGNGMVLKALMALLGNYFKN